MTKEYYFIDSDDDGHNVIIPMSKEKEWNEWSELDNDDERKWDSPDFAIHFDGHHSSVIFSDFKLRK